MKTSRTEFAKQQDKLAKAALEANGQFVDLTVPGVVNLLVENLPEGWLEEKDWLRLTFMVGHQAESLNQRLLKLMEWESFEIPTPPNRAELEEWAMRLAALELEV